MHVWILVLTVLLYTVPIRSVLVVDDSELVMCYLDSTCSEGGETMTTTQCCVESDGLAFQPLISTEETASCMTCIVFGWLNDSLTAPEDGFMYPLHVGYLKGAVESNHNLLFTVTPRTNTAALDDITLFATRINFINSMPFQKVLIRFNVDNIAQEGDETMELQLQLGAPLPSTFHGINVFFRDIIPLRIIDSDVVTIEFNEMDYRAVEYEQKLTVKISKNKKLAFPLQLRVSPLTITQAKDLSMTLPPSLPIIDDPMSPVEADNQDFDANILEVIFDADENAELFMHDRKSVQIPIMDDSVNEAMDQVFVVHLELINAVEESKIKMGRTEAVCRIMDDDIIRIGFMEPSYVFAEPSSEPTVIREVLLAKENGKRSEQTFHLAISTRGDSPNNTIQAALLSTTDYQGNIYYNDYMLTVPNKSTVVVELLPNMESVSFSFTLFPDKLIEGIEAFEATCTRDKGSPGFIKPLKLFSSTLIMIEAEVCEIGFEKNITVMESIGSQEVCVFVLHPASDTSFPPDFNVLISFDTHNGTADNSDYIPLKSSTKDVVLSIDNTHRRVCFDMVITDDKIIEENETFTIEMSMVQQPSLEVTMFPSKITVTIQDDDGICYTSAINSTCTNNGCVECIDGYTPPYCCDCVQPDYYQALDKTCKKICHEAAVLNTCTMNGCSQCEIGYEPPDCCECTFNETRMYYKTDNGSCQNTCVENAALESCSTAGCETCTNHNFTGPGCCTPLCEGTRDIYFVIDTTLSNDAIPFCETMYAVQLLTRAIDPSTDIQKTRFGVYFYPKDTDTSDENMQMFKIGQYNCSGVMVQFHRLVKEFSFGIKKGFQDKIFGTITLPKLAIDLLARDISYEINTKNVSQNRRRIVVILTDGENDGDENALKMSIDNLTNLGRITVIVAGIATDYNTVSIEKFKEGLINIANGNSANVIIGSTAKSVSEGIALTLADNDAICQDEALDIISTLRENTVNLYCTCIVNRPWLRKECVALCPDNMTIDQCKSKPQCKDE